MFSSIMRHYSLVTLGAFYLMFSECYASHDDDEYSTAAQNSEFQYPYAEFQLPESMSYLNHDRIQRDCLNDDEITECIWKYIPDPNLVETEQKGHMFRVTNKDGESNIILGTCHYVPRNGDKIPDFYEKLLFPAGRTNGRRGPGKFGKVLKENNIKKLYYEIDMGPSNTEDWNTLNLDPRVFWMDLRCQMEDMIVESLQTMDLEIDCLETNRTRATILAELNASWPAEDYPDWHDTKLHDAALRDEMYDDIRVLQAHLTQKLYYHGSHELWFLLSNLWDSKISRTHTIQRNLQWFEKLKGEAGNAIVAGATHLYGAHGLLNLFRINGWEVEIVDVWPKTRLHLRECTLFRYQMDLLNKYYDMGMESTAKPPYGLRYARAGELWKLAPPKLGLLRNNWEQIEFHGDQPQCRAKTMIQAVTNDWVSYPWLDASQAGTDKDWQKLCQVPQPPVYRRLLKAVLKSC